MVTAIVEFLGPLYGGLTGYLVMAVLVFADRAVFTGAFLPGELFVALGGVFAARGDLNIVAVALVAFAAALSGEVFSYWLGNRYGKKIIEHVPFARRFEKHLDQSHGYFKKHGGRTVFVGRYVSVVGTFIPFVAGMSKMPFARFLAFDVLALGLWATTMSLLGYLLNSQIETIDSIVSRFGWGLLVLIGAYVAWKLFRRKRKES